MLKRNILAILCLVLILNISLVSSSSLRVTQEHPFYVNGKWIEAKDLKIGDNLTTIDGKQARITSIDDIVDNVPVYNLETELYHNFVVGDENLIVHNSDPIVKTVYSGDQISGKNSMIGTYTGKNFVESLKPIAKSQQQIIDEAVSAIPESDLVTGSNILKIPTIKYILDHLPSQTAKEFFLQQISLLSSKNYRFYDISLSINSELKPYGGFANAERRIIAIPQIKPNTYLFDKGSALWIFEHEYQHIFGKIRSLYFSRGVGYKTVVQQSYFVPHTSEFLPSKAIIFEKCQPKDLIVWENPTLLALDEVNSELYAQQLVYWFREGGRFPEPYVFNSYELLGIRMRSSVGHFWCDYGTCPRLGNKILSEESPFTPLPSMPLKSCPSFLLEGNTCPNP